MNSSWNLLCFGLIAISLTLIQPIYINCNINQNESQSSRITWNHQTPAQDIGDNRSFWNFDFDEDVYYLIDAFLLAIGNHCYIYIEDSVINILGEEEALDRAELYRDEFDTIIYPRVTDFAGDPEGTLGDIDGDPRFFILVMENRWSCYRQTNEIEASYSNMCEMVYICYRTNNPLNTIAHEFHHLVWFNYEFDEVHFILEGLAEYATYYAGYLPNHNMTVRVPYILNDPNNSLIYFDIEPEDYGASYLLAFYLAEQYGVQFLRDLVQHEDDGALGLETALNNAGHNISFNELYMDWMTALTIDEQGFEDNRYCLQDIDATFQEYTTIDSFPYQNDNVTLYCYGSEVYQIQSPPDNFTIEMSQPTDGIAAISVAYKDANGWHVQQIQRQGQAIMNIAGDSIVTAHIAVSYLFVEAPAGDIDFGSGLHETVQILVCETEEKINTPIPTPINSNQFLLMLTGGISAPIMIIALGFFSKKRNKK
jgi:hypothetical protein